VAKFTQEVKPTNDPTYTAPSRDPDRLRPDRSMETLFAGIGDAVGGVAQILDDRNMRNIEKDAYAGVDPLRDQQGVEAAIATDGDLWGNKGVKVAQAGGPMALNKPPAADDAGRSVRTLTDAFNAGKIGPTQYYTRLEVLSRQMRTRYPGYRSEVDKTIQSITGINPANAIVRQVNSDLEEQRRAAQSGRDDTTKLVRKAILDGMVPLSVVDRYNKGEASAEEVLYEATKEARKSNVLTELNKEAEYQSKVGGDWKTTANRAASHAANTMVSETILNAADSVKLFDTARAMTESGKIPTPEEQAQLTSGIAAAKAKIAMSLDKTLHSPVLNMDGVKQSYATVIGPEAVKKIKEEAMSRFDAVEQMVLNKEYGLLTATARDLKAQGEAQQMEAMKDPFFKALAGIPTSAREWIGPVIASNPEFTKGVVGALQARLAVARSGGTGSFTEGLDTLRKTNNKDPKMWQTYLNTAVSGITDPKAPPEVRKNHVKAIFGDKENNSLASFKEEQRAAIYSRLASPQVTEAVKALKDPEAWGMYENWTRQNFDRLLTTQFQTLGKAVGSGNANYTLKWDGVQLRPELTPEAMKRWETAPNWRRSVRDLNSGPDVDAPDFAKVMGQADWKALNDINLSVRTLGPVVKAGGGKVEEVVTQTLMMNSPKDGDETSFLGKFWNSMTGAGEPASAEDSTKASAQDKFRRSRSQPQPPTVGKQSALDFDNATVQQASLTEGGSRRPSRRDGPLDFDDAKLVDDAKVNPGVNIDNVDPALRSYGESLSEKWGITITSGHRDPFRNRAVGGAENSQHIPGKALDFSLRGLPVEDRMALIDEILNNPEVGGIGMYGDGSIHVDYRKGGKAAWGSDRSSLDGTPTWFRQRIERWRGKDI